MNSVDNERNLCIAHNPKPVAAKSSTLNNNTIQPGAIESGNQGAPNTDSPETKHQGGMAKTIKKRLALTTQTGKRSETIANNSGW